MARIRTIKPEFWEDKEIGKLPYGCRLFFIGLWNFADDNGVFEKNPTLLKSKIFPYDDTLRVSEVTKWLDALENARMLIPIIHAGESYYAIRTFRSHQLIDKRFQRSIIPTDLIDSVLKKHIVTTMYTHGNHVAGNGNGNGNGEYNSNSDELLCGNPLDSHAGQENHPNSDSEKKSESINFDALVDFFNTETNGVFGTIRNPLSKKRKGLVRARIAEHGKEAFVEVIRKAITSNYLRGQSGKNFTATFDWLILPTNFEKTLSGNYDNRKNENEKSGRNGQSSDERIAEVLRATAQGCARATTKQPWED